MPEPLVTVLTAARNAAQHLTPTLDSVRAQTMHDWEYIVVDDASTDETADLVAAASSGDPRIRLVRRPTAGGPYAAANTGLQHARGRWVVRLDADDVCPPRRLEAQTEFLGSQPRLRAAAGYWQSIDASGRLDPRVRTVPESSGVLRWRLCVLGGLVHSSLCIDRDALRQLGNYREEPVSQDYRLWCDLTRRGWLGVVGEVVVHWRTHAGQIGANRQALQRRYHLQILTEHLEALTGEPWPPEQVTALWAAGRALEVDVAAGVRALDRWDRAWRADRHLDGAERRELEHVSVMLRLRHLRRNGRAHPLRGIAGVVRVLSTRPTKIPGALARGRHAYW